MTDHTFKINSRVGEIITMMATMNGTTEKARQAGEIMTTKTMMMNGITENKEAKRDRRNNDNNFDEAFYFKAQNNTFSR
jgi:hypothetical protein